jgi:hypothetical protein
MADHLAPIANHMTRQMALVTRRQLYSEGISRKQIEQLVRNRTLLRLRCGVYRLRGAPVSWEQASLAAVLAGGDTAVASHSSAARLWVFRIQPATALEITVLRPRHPELEGVIVHSTTLLSPADVAERAGVPCTSFERTLCDSTADLSLMQIGRTLDDGIRRGVTSLDRLRECVLRLDSGPRRRLTVAQELLRQRDHSHERAGSYREHRVIRVLRDADVPMPTQQHRVRIGSRTFFLDYAYVSRRRFIEYYELGSHGTPSAVAYDNERLTLLCNQGWMPLIFTDATSDEEIVARTLEALAADHAVGA